ncbi:MAG: sel1 repeat family protein [Rhodospirillales bacterium]|nr:sel1 repeat family protein [Rhodospirillales bacterium]
MRSLLLIVAKLCLMLPSGAGADYAAGIAAYRNGDYKEARLNFEPEAKAGDSRAQLGLGLIHHKGLGVQRNLEEAAKWYRMAAEQGNAAAQNNLGVLHRNGNGVRKDLREAFSWFWMAAMQGHPRAELNLADMYRLGQGVPADPLLAYIWLDFAIMDLPVGGRKVARERREQLVTEMSAEDVERAKRMVDALRESRRSN